MAFGTIEQAIEAIRDGKFVIVADDEDRENEGDLICAAELITPEMVNFMIKKAGGLICLALSGDRVDALGLDPMSETNLDDYRTNYTVSIDASARFGVTTGISAHDRARTIRVCATGATCSRSGRAKAASSSVRATRRLPWTSPVSPAFRPPASCARS
jgi:3,4-dihydroxy 2-butanone 4-phosphate synthase/GTP cyclohydrolase II